jgi:hypothetical protein
MAGGVGVATRRSETVGHDLLYVAVPGGPGVIRVAASLEQVDDIVRRAQGAVAGAALLALLVGTLFALIAGRSIAQPLTAITAAARPSPRARRRASPARGCRTWMRWCRRCGRCTASSTTASPSCAGRRPSRRRWSPPWSKA